MVYEKFSEKKNGETSQMHSAQQIGRRQEKDIPIFLVNAMLTSEND